MSVLSSAMNAIRPIMQTYLGITQQIIPHGTIHVMCVTLTFSEPIKQTQIVNMSNMPLGTNNSTAHYIREVTNMSADEHYVLDTVGWDGGSQGCVYCHRTGNGEVFNATNISALSNYDGIGNDCYGAQYRIMNGGAEALSWTAMTASDGNFNGSSDIATAIISTAALSSGTYTVEVRGMGGGSANDTSIRYYPMNGDVSAIQSTSLTVEPPVGYIYCIVSASGSPLAGAIVSVIGASTTTAADGTYSLGVVAGTYDVTASKAPEYNDNTTIGIAVTSNGTTMQNSVLSLKQTASVTGNVANSTV